MEPDMYFLPDTTIEGALLWLKDLDAHGSKQSDEPWDGRENNMAHVVDIMWALHNAGYELYYDMDTTFTIHWK